MAAEENFYELSLCRLGMLCNYASRKTLLLAWAVSVGGCASTAPEARLCAADEPFAATGKEKPL